MRVLKIFLLVLIVAMLGTTTVRANAGEDILADVSKTYTVGGKELTISEADKVRIERYISEHEITEAQRDIVLEKFHAILDIMNSENVSDVAYLSKANKDKAIKLAEEGAAALNLRLVADTVPNTIKIYDANGKLIESAKIEKGKLIYTGSNTPVLAVASLVAVIAVATFVINRKKVNA